MATTPGAAHANVDTTIGSIERMVQLDSHGYITIEIGTERLPTRMVARRIGTDLRTSRGLVAGRRMPASRLVVAMMAAILVPLIGVARFRHASAGEAPAV